MCGVNIADGCVKKHIELISNISFTEAENLRLKNKKLSNSITDVNNNK